MPETSGIAVPPAGERFAAFISYSHADAVAAGKLQRQLERYRLPRNVSVTQDKASASLGRIFRDREDLAAAPSLSDAIRDAIARADALVVVCSPDARQSRWVNDEIALFRELHPQRPVLAALVRGEPGEAFPDALTANGVEPLAADLRKEADGWSLGFLKIVAGITALPLDALVQRDAQRRVRRVMAITLGAVAGMLVMAVMTVFAIQSRNEAARQRASAEGLVEYMLTDLRDKLRGVGRLDVMTDVNERAMEHYRRQGDLSDLPADSLERRARILHAMGEDLDKSGDLVGAEAKFTEAFRATRELLRREPDSADRIFAHAQSEYWVGHAAWRQRDRATTGRHWNGYVRQAAKLLVVDTDRARAHLEMGYALGNMCDLYLADNHDLKKAADYCERSIVEEKKALGYKPDDVEIQQALANRYGWLADVRLAQKDYAAARKARLEERIVINRLLAADPKNYELQTRSVWPDFGLAKIDIIEGKVAAAVGKMAAIEQRLTALSAAAPDNTDVLRTLARAQLWRAESLVPLDDAAARLALAKARATVDRLARKTGQRGAMDAYRAMGEKIERELSK